MKSSIVARSVCLGLLCGLLAWLCGSVTAVAAPSPPVRNLRVLKTLPAANKLLADQHIINLERGRVVAFDRSRLINLTLPLKLDYSSEVTFIRCQDGGGGCPGITLLHISDILHEWEHPYTPDLSFRGVDQVNANQILAAGKAGQPFPPDLGRNTFTLLGLPSEALHRSNYDTVTPRLMTDTTGLWKKGDQVGWEQDLSPEAQAECALYKVNFSDPFTFEPKVTGHLTADDLKRLLFRYGPIYAGGWWRQINSNPDEGHVMTIVGYDDTTRRFKYLNSWGSWFTKDCPTPSYGTISYDDLFWPGGTEPALGPGQSYDDLRFKYSNIDDVRYLTSIPSERWTSPDAYSARIRIRHAWRATLNVKIGVEGQPLLTVYDTRGRLADRRGEWNSDLDLDVPLPAYAAKFWPPSPSRRWLVRVEDCDRDGLHGTIVEFTLAKLSQRAGCFSLGRFPTETFGGSCSVAIPDPSSGAAVPPAGDLPDTPNASPGVAETFFPQQTPGPVQFTAKPVLRLRTDYRVRLPADLCTDLGSGSIVLTADLKSHTALQKEWVPMADQTVGLYELEQNACLNKPSKWNPVATVKTKANGRASFQLKPPLGEHVYAVAYKSVEGTVLTSSFPLTYDNRPNLKPVIEYAKPGLQLVFPDLNLPRPSEAELRVLEH